MLKNNGAIKPLPRCYRKTAARADLSLDTKIRRRGESLCPVTAKLPGAMGFAAVVALAGFALTFVLPEPDHKSLETIEREGEQEDRRADVKMH